MKHAPRVRTVALWLLVAAVAVGWSVRPRPLASSDLYGSAARPAADPLAVPTGVAGSAAATDAPTEAGGAATVDWLMLASLDYATGRMSDTLRALAGTRVRVPGFIVPLDDFQDVVKEFLLVPYFGACVHTPPPPPNQIVFVRLRGDAQKVSLFDPVWIEGVLRIEQYQSVYGAVGFQLVAERVSPYR